MAVNATRRLLHGLNLCKQSFAGRPLLLKGPDVRFEDLHELTEFGFIDLDSGLFQFLHVIVFLRPGQPVVILRPLSCRLQESPFGFRAKVPQTLPC